MPTRLSGALFACLLLLLPMAARVAIAAPNISIYPSPVITEVGQSVQLKAVVVGPSQYQVKWILQGPLFDGSDAGTLTQSGVYTAPATLPRGPVRIVVQISTGQWNLPVAAASVPVDILPRGRAPPPPPPPPPPPGFGPAERFPAYPAP